MPCGTGETPVTGRPLPARLPAYRRPRVGAVPRAVRVRRVGWGHPRVVTFPATASTMCRHRPRTAAAVPARELLHVHLKSLTLRGFKSFASATTLRFEP